MPIYIANISIAYKIFFSKFCCNERDGGATLLLLNSDIFRYLNRTVTFSQKDTLTKTNGLKNTNKYSGHDSFQSTGVHSTTC
jgi:hypothetical protein